MQLAKKWWIMQYTQQKAAYISNRIQKYRDVHVPKLKIRVAFPTQVKLNELSKQKVKILSHLLS